MIFIVLILSGAVFYIFKAEMQVADKNDERSLYSIYTSIYPVYEVASRIIGDKNTVELVVPSGTEIHSYEPSPRRLADLEKAALFFYIGIGLEPWAEKMAEGLNNSGVKTIELSKYLQLIRYNEEIEETGTQDHHHGTYDPHVWLEPENMGIIASVIKDELITLDPENRDNYLDNYERYIEDIDELLKNYDNTLKELQKDTIIVSHAAFGYLARRYNFQQLAVTSISSHGEPTPGNLARIINIARDKKLKYIFLEPQIDKKVVEVIAEEADLAILILNPFIGLTEEEIENKEDYFSIMAKNLMNLKKALVDENG